MLSKDYCPHILKEPDADCTTTWDVQAGGCARTHLHSDDLVVLVDAEAKLCGEQVIVIIPGGVS